MLSNKEFVYYGTSEFSADILRGLIAAGLKPKLVITTLSKPAGRGLKTIPTPAMTEATKNNLAVLPANSLKNPETFNKIKEFKTSFSILAAFGKIIPPEIIELYPKGIVNIHPSLLPLYRGPSPIQYAILDDQEETGVSLMLLDAQVDHGPILSQEKCSINKNENANTLSKKLSSLAIHLLLKNLPDYLNDKLIPAEQNHSKATFTKIITREAGQADFNKNAVALDSQRRAFAPWPGLWTTWHNKRLKLIETTALPEKISFAPGTVQFYNDVLIINTGSGALLINSLQLEGGKVLNPADFIRGHADFNNSTLPS